MPIHNTRECCGTCYRHERKVLRCEGQHFTPDGHGGCKMHFPLSSEEKESPAVCSRCGIDLKHGGVCCDCLTDQERLMVSGEYDRAMRGYGVFD